MKCLLFDLDGTLVDDEYSLREGLRAICNNQVELLYQKSFDEILNFWRTVTEKYFRLYINGEIDLRTHRRTRIQELFRYAGALAEISIADEMFEVYLEGYAKSWRCFPDVFPALEQLDQYHLAVLSNGRSVQQKQKVEKTGLAKYFRTVLCPEDVGCAKPATGAFHKACEVLDINKEDCIYIGDNFEIDIIGSREAGIKPIWIQRVSEEFRNLPFDICTVNSLCELPSLLGAARY